MDDPAFAIDSALPALDLELWDLRSVHNDPSQHSTQSMLSIRPRTGSASSIHAPSVLGLNISSSSNGIGVYQLPIDPLDDYPTQKALDGSFINDEDMMYNDDDMFEFDDDGNIRDILPSERETRRATNSTPYHQHVIGSATSSFIRDEHLGRRAIQVSDDGGDFNIRLFSDLEYDLPRLPITDPLPIHDRESESEDETLRVLTDALFFSGLEDPSFQSAEAQQKRRRKGIAKIKTLKLDQQTELKNADLISWNKNYIEYVAKDSLLKKNRKILKTAKKAAFQFVYGAGLNCVGSGFGSEHFLNHLAIFSGQALLSMLGGIPSPTLGAVEINSKRQNPFSVNEQSTPNKRQALEDEVGRGLEGEDLMQLDDYDQSIEVGRDAPSALADYPSSSMPWNKSASVLSYQKLQSSGLGSQAGRRLTSASPLVGRGSILPTNLIGEQDEMVMYGRSESLAPSQPDISFGPRERSSSHVIGRVGAPQDFEQVGAASIFGTQATGKSQWVRDVLDHESGNFFQYIKNSIDERFGIQSELLDYDTGADELGKDTGLIIGSSSKRKNRSTTKDVDRNICFDQLFIPGQDTHIVAAQAFYHVLTLATKGQVRAHQTKPTGVADLESCGKIWLGIA
jgi:meiotic recombination protein REC8